MVPTRSALLLLSLIGLLACRPSRAPAPHEVARGAGDGTGAGPGANADEELDNPAQRFHEATIFVDGEPRLAFSYNELPATVRVEEYDWDGEGHPAHRMQLVELVRALGVDLASLKALHWYGGRDRVAVMSGEELRRHPERFSFNFSRDLFGKPRVDWRGARHTADMVDIVTDLALYVDRPAPRWSPEAWAVVDETGRPFEGIPYAREEMPRRAVRVNVDGRLVAVIKRNLLEGNLTPVMPGARTPRYRLDELLAQRRIRVEGALGIDLITRDERVVRLSRADAARGVQFEMARHGGGVVEAYFGSHHVPAKAISVYLKAPPPERPMRTWTLQPASGSALSGEAAEPFGRTATARR